jgi:hypothetical protein
MSRLATAFGIAIALFAQGAFARHRLTDPVKIGRECKTEVELFCKAVRPGSQRIVGCLKEKMTELSPACLAAIKSTE